MGVRSYPKDCYHHYPVFLGVVYCGQFVIETLYIRLKRFALPLLNAGKAAQGSRVLTNSLELEHKHQGKLPLGDDGLRFYLMDPFFGYP